MLQSRDGHFPSQVASLYVLRILATVLISLVSENGRMLDPRVGFAFVAAHELDGYIQTRRRVRCAPEERRCKNSDAQDCCSTRGS
jgi:hypothetical protein